MKIQIVNISLTDMFVCVSKNILLILFYCSSNWEQIYSTTKCSVITKSTDMWRQTAADHSVRHPTARKHPFHGKKSELVPINNF